MSIKNPSQNAGGTVYKRKGRSEIKPLPFTVSKSIVFK
jgi:hypothetical protein